MRLFGSPIWKRFLPRVSFALSETRFSSSKPTEEGVGKNWNLSFSLSFGDEGGDDENFFIFVIFLLISNYSDYSQF